MELQEAVKLWSKRDRESLMNNRSKRKRTSSKQEEGEESTEESIGDEFAEDEEYSTVVVDDNNHRRSARSLRHWKVADEMIGVSVSRKARFRIEIASHILNLLLQLPRGPLLQPIKYHMLQEMCRAVGLIGLESRPDIDPNLEGGSLRSQIMVVGGGGEVVGDGEGVTIAGEDEDDQTV
nr:hypothetical protein CFP56_44673 [Quercus suber]